MPSKIFDAHLHIIDPAFPLVENDGFVPEPFNVVDYLERIDGLGIAGGAVVSGSFQAFDQDYLIQSLKDLGPNYVGVTQLPETVSDDEILRLNAAGVRAVRFNARRGGSASLSSLDTLARRVYEVAGWHTELYIDARVLDSISAQLQTLPAISIDHLGLHADGLSKLLRLVESGAKVKATGFGRIDLDPASVIQAILEVNPRALVVGTDLPSTRAKRPFSDQDFDLISRTVDPELLPAVLWDNAAELYLNRPRYV